MSQEVASQEAISQQVMSQEVISQEVLSQEVAHQEVMSQEVISQHVTGQYQAMVTLLDSSHRHAFFPPPITLSPHLASTLVGLRVKALG